MILDTWFDQRATTAQSSLTTPTSWLVDLLTGGPTSSGKTVTEETALQLPTVYACVRILSEAMMIVPMKLYRRNGDSREEARTHPLWNIFNRAANSEMTAATWQEVSQVHRSLWGNSYSLIVRNRRGDVAELLPLLPNCTYPERMDNGMIYYCSTINGESFKFPARDVLHIKAMGGDGLCGWSPIRVQREQIGSMIAQQEFGGRLYKNNATLGGILTTTGIVQDKEKLRKEWQAYVGSDNAFKTAVLDQGMDYKAIGIPPEDAQYIETQKLNAAQIANIFGVPEYMLNQLERATFNNVEHLGIQFVKHTMMSWYRRVEQECAFKLLRPQDRDLYFKFEANALMRGDFKTRTEGYAKALGGPGTQGYMTINEIRALEDLNPVDDGNEIVKAGAMEVAPEEPQPQEENNGIFARSIEDRTHDREYSRFQNIVESKQRFEEIIPKLARHWSMAYGMRDADARKWASELVCDRTDGDEILDRNAFAEFIRGKMNDD